MHEVSNPLNFMKTGLHLLRGKVSAVPEADQAEVSEMLKDIEDGLSRVQGIVGDLRRFAHPDPSLREQARVEDLVGVSLRFLAHELKDGVKVVKAIDPGHCIHVNKNQMVHVLINLVQNAIYAVRRKENRTDEPCVWIESSAVNGVDRVIVRDNGAGIRGDHLDKIFEPFFTTKAVGEGTGLGLSICYRIVEQHQGRIVVDSKLGEYCRFTIELPRRDDMRHAAS
jgi:signal transduction histidine kinase